MQREFFQQLVNTLQNIFVVEQTKVITEYTIKLPNDLRRIIDIFIDSKRYGLYIVEVKSYSAVSNIGEEIYNLLPIAQAISSTNATNERGIHFVIVLSDITRTTFMNLTGQDFLESDNFGTPWGEVLVIFADEIQSAQRLSGILFSAPRLPNLTGIDLPLVDKKHQIFLSYRRADSAWTTGRIADYLRNVYSEDDVFFDVLSIDLGDDFLTTIKNRIEASSVLIAVISNKWVKIAFEDDGRRRLDDPDDTVKLEIVTALNKKLLVIPMLIDDTPMPRNYQLPDELHKLTIYNAGRLRVESFHSDIQILVKRLDRFFAKKKP